MANSNNARLRTHWLDRERMLLYPSLILLGGFIVLFGVWTARGLAHLTDPDPGTPFGNDFIGFWSAARLAAEGRPEAAYNESAIVAMHQVAVPGLALRYEVLWLHPPTFLLAVFPLGLLPYLLALATFLLVTVTFWAALVRCMFADPRAWVVAAAFPAGLWNFSTGQSGFVTAGLAGFSLLALEHRPRVSGVLIGLLAIKPHLAVLFPIVLVAERRWETLLAATLTALTFTALSVVVFGWPTMQAFLANLMTVRGLIDRHELDWLQMPSIYASVLSFGFSSSLAMELQIVFALGAIIAVWFTWRAQGAPREAKLATLSAGSLLISPYLFFYDLTWTGLAISWLAKLGCRRGFDAGQRELLATAWVFSCWVMIAKVSGVQLGWTLPLALTVMGVICARHH